MVTQEPITKHQLNQLHTLLNATGQTAYKQDLMDYYCVDGRFPTSSKELYFVEAEAIIKHLTNLQKDQDKQLDNMRKNVIGCLREAGYNNNGRADMPKIYNWVQKYSATKKELNKHDYNELVALVTQAEAYKKNYLRGLKK